jgi:hypothetical protein
MGQAPAYFFTYSSHSVTDRYALRLDSDTFCRFNGLADYKVGSHGMTSGDGGMADLIQQWRSGNIAARDALIQRMLPELRLIAAARLRGEINSSLSTDDLINDAILRFMRLSSVSLVDRAHFIALSSRIMPVSANIRRLNSIRRSMVANALTWNPSISRLSGWAPSIRR